VSEGLDRRQFLTTTAAGMVLTFVIPVAERARAAPAAAAFTPNAALTITPDGIVTVHSSRVEIGQGIGTALAQIVADELEADWKDVRVDYPAYEAKQGPLSTTGSLSVKLSFPLFSRAGAAARIVLVDAAARLWNVDAADCVAERGVVRHPPTGRSISYGELVARVPITKTFTADELKAIPLKKPSQYRLIGRWIPRLDIPEKVDGRAKFGIDVFLPGMAYAKIAYPPTRAGGRHRAVDDSAARRVKGHLKTVVTGDLVAVVAETYEAAVAARDALRIVWHPGPHASVSSASILADYERRARQDAGIVWSSAGDPRAALAGAATTHAATYVTDFAVQAQLEPTNCVARYDNGVYELYTGSQWPSRVTAVLSRSLGVEPTKVRIHPHYLGGAFGRKLDVDTELEAAIIAREAGRPIKLIRSREEDFHRGFYRPLTLQILRAGLDAGGRIVAWEHVLLSPSRTAEVATLDPSGRDPRSMRGGDHYYEIPNQLMRWIRAETGIPIGSYRSVEPSYTGFALESFLDELAHLTKVDPLQLRLGMLGTQPRLAHVLRLAAARAGWGTPLPAGTGRGLAVAPAWRRSQSWIAAVVQARIDRVSGEVRVEKITCAVDCGVVVSPDGVRSQIEGGLLFGLSTALKEHASVSGGALDQKNFEDYSILRMDEVPDVAVHVVDGTEPPTGVGEPGTATVAPALANAIFDATGARIRQLPFLPERVLKALRDKA